MSKKSKKNKKNFKNMNTEPIEKEDDLGKINPNKTDNLPIEEEEDTFIIPSEWTIERPTETPEAPTTPIPEEQPNQEPQKEPQEEPEKTPEEEPEKTPEEEPLFVPEEWPEPIEEPEGEPLFVPEEWPEPVEDPTESPSVPVSVMDTPFDIGPAKLEHFDLLFQNDNAETPNKKHKFVNASDNAYPNKELNNLVDQQRRDTSEWQNQENLSPISNIVIARVFLNNQDTLEGAKVLLQTKNKQIIGKVSVDAEDGFFVEWRNGQSSIEKKSNYELIIVESNEKDVDWKSVKIAEGQGSNLKGTLPRSTPTNQKPIKSFGEGRVCIEPSCTTILSRYTRGSFCNQHEKNDSE